MFLRTKRPAPPATEIRPLALADGREVPVRWVRDRRARRLRLIVSDKGARLTLPTVASVRMADAFLHEHREWLADQPIDAFLSTMGFSIVGGPASSTKPGHYHETAADLLGKLDVLGG